MDTYTSEELFEQLPNLIDDLIEKNGQCKVTTPNGNIVLLSEEMYLNILVTLELLSTPGLMQSVELECTQEQ